LERDVLSVIEAASIGLSKSQRRIAEYLLENYDKAAFMSASRLASFIQVSESTVVRFAAEVGYDGYPEMRRAIQDMIRGTLAGSQSISIARDIRGSRDILTHTLSSDIDLIRQTMEETDINDFVSAVETILDAESIYILGLKSESYLASIMGLYFNRIFNNSHVISENPGAEVIERCVGFTDKDVLIAICFPNYSKRTIRAMQYARGVGLKIIAITDSSFSPLSEIADISLYVRNDKISFLDTLVAPLSLVNALVLAVSERAPVDMYADFEHRERVWDEYGGHAQI